MRVSPISQGTWFVDPNIVALSDGTLIISYVALASPDLPESVGTSRVAVSSDGGLTWQSAQTSSAGFLPSSLGFHCSRQRYFLGEYHDPAVLGNRSVHITHRESSGRSVFRTFFATRSHWY